MLAQRFPTLAGEEVPLDEARRTSRGPRMNPGLHDALRQNIPTRMPLLEGTSLTTMKNHALMNDHRTRG